MLISRRRLALAAGTMPLLGRRARADAKTLRFGLSSYPPNLQPFVSTGQAAATVKMLIFRGLLSFGPDGQLQGELAERWQRDGETGWIFYLRDAVFQSGAPVTAADVAWSIEQVRGEHSTAYLRGPLQGVQSVETLDPRTVRIALREPMVTLPLWMANAHMPVIERRSVESGGPPVGAGPYRLVSQERGVALELAAFDKFYKPDRPKMPRIRMIAYADENLRVAALKAMWT